MNLLERLILWGGLLAVGAVGLVVLVSLGVNIPFLPAFAPPGSLTVDEEPGGYGLPPPDFPEDEEEPSLLAELSSPIGDPWAISKGSARADAGHEAFAAASRESETAPALNEKVIAALGRDPLVDQLKAGVDVTDAGQVLAFLMATFTAKGTKLGEEDLEFLLGALAEQEDYGLRNLLFAHLERIAGDGVTEGVLAFLAEEKNPASIGRALSVLRSQGDQAAVEGLVEFLATSKNRKLQDMAFKNLLGTKSDAAVDPLLEVLRNTENKRTKQFALAALTQLGGAIGAEAVLGYAGSSDPFERKIGLGSLRDLKSPDAVPVLADGLGRSSDTGLRISVVRTLGRIRDPRAVDSVSHVALYGENRGIRMEAMKSLARIGSVDALPALNTIAETDANLSMVRSAQRTISYLEKVHAREAARAARQRTR